MSARAGATAALGRTSPLTPAVVTLLDLVGAAVTASLLVMAGLELTGPVRILLALAFVTFVPGWAAVGHLHLLEGASRIALAVALSLAMCTALAQALLWLRRWDTAAMLNGLGTIALAVLLAQLAWARARPASGAGR
jgi:uncharacterized membrane protein